MAALGAIYSMCYLSNLQLLLLCTFPAWLCDLFCATAYCRWLSSWFSFTDFVRFCTRQKSIIWAQAQPKSTKTGFWSVYEVKLISWFGLLPSIHNTFLIEVSVLLASDQEHLTTGWQWRSFEPDLKSEDYAIGSLTSRFYILHTWFMTACQSTMKVLMSRLSCPSWPVSLWVFPNAPPQKPTISTMV